MLVGCNSQTKRSECYKPISLNNLQSLPTEAEWKAAAETNSTIESNPNSLVYSIINLQSLPTEAEWKKAATFDKRLNAK